MQKYSPKDAKLELEKLGIDPYYLRHLDDGEIEIAAFCFIAVAIIMLIGLIIGGILYAINVF